MIVCAVGMQEGRQQGASGNCYERSIPLQGVPPCEGWTDRILTHGDAIVDLLWNGSLLLSSHLRLFRRPREAQTYKRKLRNRMQYTAAGNDLFDFFLLCGFAFRRVGLQRFLQLHFQNAVHCTKVGDQVTEVQE